MPSSNLYPPSTQPAQSAQDRHIGTIFLGPSADRETTLDKLYSAVQTDVWNKKTEDDYMERVRERAAEKVRALLTNARKKAEDIHKEAQDWADTTRELAEATQEEARRNLEDAKELRQQALILRDQAHKEGFEEGRQEALKELDEAKAALADTTAAVLLGIHQQCSHIFDTWREDLVALFKEALEKATGWILDAEKAKIMESLLTQSMKALQDKRHFLVRVHPQDAELLTEMLADAHKANPHTANWELESDPKLAPGSIVVESDSGLVNNSRESRRAVVEEVLQHLTLPHSQADEEAMADVTYTLVTNARGNGIDLDPEGSIVPHDAPAPKKAPADKKTTNTPVQETAPETHAPVASHADSQEPAEASAQAPAAPEAAFFEPPVDAPDISAPDLPDDLPDNLPGTLPDDLLGSSPDFSSVDSASDLLADVFGDLPDASAHTQEAKPASAPVAAPQAAPQAAKAPEQKPEQLPAQAPEHAAEHTAEKSPAEKPAAKQTPKQAPAQTSVQTSPEKADATQRPNLLSDEEIHSQAQDLVDSFLADAAPDSSPTEPIAPITPIVPSDTDTSAAPSLADTADATPSTTPDATADTSAPADIDPFEAALAASAASAASSAASSGSAPASSAKKAPGEPLPDSLADELLADLGFAPPADPSSKTKADL